MLPMYGLYFTQVVLIPSIIKVCGMWSRLLEPCVNILWYHVGSWIHPCLDKGDISALVPSSASPPFLRCSGLRCGTPCSPSGSTNHRTLCFCHWRWSTRWGDLRFPACARTPRKREKKVGKVTFGQVSPLGLLFIICHILCLCYYCFCDHLT